MPIRKSIFRQPDQADSTPNPVPPSTANSAAPRKSKDDRGKARFGIRALALILFTAVLCTAALFWIRYWPFAQKSVIQDLQEASDSRVQIRAFHSTYFPNPGCVLDGVMFSHGPDTGKPLITIERLTIQSTYLNILARRISRVTAEGMRVIIPPFGSGQPFHTTHSTITIDQLVANGSTLEFSSQNPNKQHLRFDIHEATLGDVGWEGAFTYRVKVHNPEPPGEISAQGKFGGWVQNDAGKTPVSGEYQFERADLSVYHGIAGVLSSSGKFDGTLAHIEISGTTDTPDFEVKSGGHPTRLSTKFSAYVDAMHGDTFLKRVDAQFRKTHVVASGSIAGSSNSEGKTALIDLSAQAGRIEDILGLFIQKERSPMSGLIALRTKVEIPPSDEPFLRKVKLSGGFGIGGGEFSQPSTQEAVNNLSAGARGEKDRSDPETVLTDLTGRVTMENGVAHFADLSFGVPGAAARMQGTYNLIDYKIDLHGQMQLDTKISNTSSGAKAFLLKMMDPFFKKKNKGEILPIKISGTFRNPSFGLDLEDKKAEQVKPPSHTSAAPAPPHGPGNQ